jgi:hypothetical protein
MQIVRRHGAFHTPTVLSDRLQGTCARRDTLGARRTIAVPAPGWGGTGRIVVSRIVAGRIVAGRIVVSRIVVSRIVVSRIKEYAPSSMESCARTDPTRAPPSASVRLGPARSG